LERLAKELGVESNINFVGSVNNKDLPTYLLKSDIYVSTFTGTSLREASLCGLPAVVYNVDWVPAVFTDEETALLVPARDYAEMARQVLRLAKDDKLYKEMSSEVESLAFRLWSPEGLQSSLEKAFEEN
jgi:glycosyltransferase involved in cell wall biosynthesis